MILIFNNSSKNNIFKQNFLLRFIYNTGKNKKLNEKIDKITEFYDDFLETEEDSVFADGCDEVLVENYYDPIKRKFLGLDKALIDSRPMVFLNTYKIDRPIKFLTDMAAAHTSICIEVLQENGYNTNKRKMIKNSAGIRKETYATFFDKDFDRRSRY